jgi:2-polyprenyl-3-methyl-5-hydroxy-6-metoxy-1,4-benzoquinol methylase
MEKLTQCPACHSANIKYLNKAKDHSVSGETFNIWYCAVCECRFTNPRPEESAIGPYYQSEDYISHSNTSQGLINTLYQKARNITLKQKLSLANSLVTQPKTLLDVGCGTGHFLHTCQQAGWEVFGTEPDKGARTTAENLLGKPLATDFLDTQFETKYQLITMWHVLEHVHRLDETLEKIKSLLAQNGTLLIAVPNYKSSDAEKYGMDWAAYDVPRHLYHFSAESIKILLKRHRLNQYKKQGMVLDSFYVSMLSEKYQKGFLGTLAGGIQGLLSNLNAAATGEFSSMIYLAKHA